MATLGNVFPANPAMKYYCNNCDFGVFTESSFEKHKSSLRHKRLNK
jgi:hypothetical protein